MTQMFRPGWSADAAGVEMNPDVRVTVARNSPTHVGGWDPKFLSLTIPEALNLRAAIDQSLREIADYLPYRSEEIPHVILKSDDA